MILFKFICEKLIKYKTIKMKKLLFLIGVSIVFFSSCIPNPTEDPDPPVETPAGLLLKKLVDTYQGTTGDSIVTSNLTYAGNKLVSAIDDVAEESDMYVTYTGNLITQIEYRYSDGFVDQRNIYTYDDTNRLVTYVRVDPEMDLGNKETYVYNADGTISVTSFIGDATTQTQTSGSVGTITFTAGEISSITGNDLTVTYTYDNKNNPMKNILGMDKIAFVDHLTSGIMHNVLTETENRLGIIDTYTYQYTYNTQDYPATSIQDDGEGTYTTAYFY